MKNNVLIRFFTAIMLLFIVSLANIGGCDNSNNGDNSPEPTPSASPSPPTPVATPIPTITPPTPAPTIAPTQAPPPPKPPAPETSQKNAATAIANLCVSLIQGASGDEGDDKLLAVYEESFNEIMELDLPSGVSDLPVAIGNIRSAVITIAAGGNEDSTALAEELASACEEDLNAL